ncbi:MAG: hypothetical protein ACQGVK_01710 [Myxococcota bacterium]
MSRTSLYTVFHANLDFSALPDRDVPLILDRCYWPILQLADESSLPLGIEMPARTLARLDREDPEWVKTLRGLVERSLVEVVGSGEAQLIGPLVPADVNRANLALGARHYREILGAVPSTWFVSEQTFSRGLPRLFSEVGARALVMEWNNPASRRSELRRWRGRPARVATGADGGLPLLWNDCIVFQRLQRAVHGALEIRDYLETVQRLGAEGGALALCAYGGDLEIFDYRPGHAEPPGACEGRELARLSGALRALAGSPRFRFELPRQVAALAAHAEIVELASPEEPIPCKKQPRYNPTRWAVSGRDGLAMNRRCFGLRRMLWAARALEAPATGPAPFDADDERLVALWRSDLRTRTTEEKAYAFHAEEGEAAARWRSRVSENAPALSPGWDALLHNPDTRSWCGEPVEVDLVLPPGRCPDLRIVADPAAAVPAGAAQVEVVDAHRDGTPRRVTLVLAPRLGPAETLHLRVEDQPRRSATASAVEVAADRVRTEAVDVRLLPRRGGAIASAAFAELGGDPLVGTIAHGSFDSIAHTPDFYSGHVVAHSEDGAKLTSLAPAECVLADAGGALRARLSFRVRAGFGDLWTHYRVYRDRPRIDVVHELDLREVRLRTLRLGVATWLPGAYSRESLAYATVNGGDGIERFPLSPGVRVEHSHPVSPTVTASSCLGATDGWVSAGDESRGVALVGARHVAAVVPMLEFADVDDAFLLRVHHSAAETDETRATFFRGRLRVPFAWIAHPDRFDGVRTSARALERGLIYRTERDIGLARGL